MEKKLLIGVCILVAVAGYFVATYQDEKRLERTETIAEEERKNEIMVQDSLEALPSFNPLLEKELTDYIETVSKDLEQSKTARRLYYLTLKKVDGKDYLIMETGYGFDQDRIKAFSRLNDNIIIYYGNPDSIEQNLIIESNLLKNLEQLNFYVDQKGSDDKIVIKKYIITDKENLSLQK